jgi:glycosyltransferase involved in cell wall biosynthesis
MHYCFLTTGTWLGNGGLERLSRLGGAMVRAGVRVSYVVDDVPANRQHLDAPQKAHIEYAPVHGSLLQQTRARRDALRRVAPDFVHVLLPALKTQLILRGTPEVRVVGDWDEWPAIRTDGPVHRRLLARWLDRWLRRRSSLIVVASQFMRDEFQRRFGLGALYLPHSGFVRDATVAPGPSPYDRATAVYMGSFYHVYDHDILFDAAELLRRRGATPAIEIIGDGPEMPHWREFVRDRGLDNVALPGAIRGAELWRRLRAAHVLLFPMRDSAVNRSRCPGKAFYYTQAQRPVIATRVGELAHVFGDRATYVEPNPQDFADAIERAVASPRATDIDYHLGTWDDRAKTLIEALRAIPLSPYSGEGQGEGPADE